MNKKETKIFLAIAIAVMLLTLGINLTTAGSTLDNYLADTLYNKTSPEKGECLVIGIDEYALEQLGPWPWSRDIMADVIDILNMDPEYKPAAIGLDITFSGTTDEYGDERLAESIAESDNVILACSANFDSRLTMDETGMYVMDKFQIADMNYPNPKFDTTLGHINAMYDTDGVLRHHLWNFEDPETNETIYSMPYEAYKLWCKARNIEADFQPHTDSKGFWFLEYNRVPGDYYTYSVMDILEGSYDPEILKDAIIFIGTYDPSSMDYFVTPTERSVRMYGIEYLANVTDTMIAGVTKQQVGIPFLIFSCMLIFAYTILLLKKPIRIGIVVFFCAIILSFIADIVFYEIGLVLNPLWHPIGYILGFVGSLLYHYLSENKKRKNITNVFSRYVDTDIIKQLLKEDSESLGLEGKECEIAIMFIDIRGFTTLSEKKTPMEVVKMLNKYLTLTSSCIKNNGGVVDKFIGDATMAFWGAPLPCEDAVYKACQAAMEMVKKAEEVDTDGASFGIGIHYGPAVVGNIGAEDRMDFTAIGDAVNTTQRIESKAPKQTVYISELVAQMLEGRIIVTPLEEKLPLKGKAEPMQLYILEGVV